MLDCGLNLKNGWILLKGFIAVIIVVKTQLKNRIPSPANKTAPIANWIIKTLGVRIG